MPSWIVCAISCARDGRVGSRRAQAVAEPSAIRPARSRAHARDLGASRTNSPSAHSPASIHPRPELSSRPDAAEAACCPNQVVPAGGPTAADLRNRHPVAGLRGDAVFNAGDIDLFGHRSDEQGLHGVAFLTSGLDEPGRLLPEVGGFQPKGTTLPKTIADAVSDHFGRNALIGRIVVTSYLLGDEVGVEERVRQGRGKVLAPGALAGAVGADHRQHPGGSGRFSPVP